MFISLVEGGGAGACYMWVGLCEYIPEKNRWMLQKKIDFQHGDIDLHLGELAEVFEKWDKVAPLLGLDDMEIDDIKDDFHKKEDQRYVPPLRVHVALAILIAG
jgi:hypothetical protein